MISEVPVIVRNLDKTKVEYLGRYKVVKFLGQGTFGTVYRCITYKGYEYAIKQIHNVKLKKMMKNELDALMSVCSKYVVRYYELFYDKNDQPCIVLELCEGGSLHDYSRKYNYHCIPEKISLEIFAKVLIGFQSIHGANLIHRDVKLQNIMMKGDIPKIGDFGLAMQQRDQEKQLQQQTTTAKAINSNYTIVGTPAYMAPEMLSGGEQNSQVDVWSLGIMLFGMLFGDYPLYDSSVHVQLEKIKAYCNPELKFEKLKKPRYQIISDDTVQLLKRLLVIDPNKRATVKELLTMNAIVSHMDKQDLVDQMKLTNPTEVVEFEKKEKPFEAQISLLKSLNSIQPEHSPVIQKLKMFSFADSLHKSHMYEESKKKSKNIGNDQISSDEDAEEEEDDDNDSGLIKNMFGGGDKPKQSKSPLHRLVAEEALLPFNQTLNIITLLVDTYKLFSEQDQDIVENNKQQQQQQNPNLIEEEFNESEINLILYFLSIVILYNFQGLNKILDERENIFNLENWESFIFSKSYLSIQRSVQADLQIWIEKTNLLYEHLKQIHITPLENQNNQKKGGQEEISNEQSADTCDSQSILQNIISSDEDEDEEEQKQDSPLLKHIEKKGTKDKEKQSNQSLHVQDKMNQSSRTSFSQTTDKSDQKTGGSGLEKETIASQNKRKAIQAKQSTNMNNKSIMSTSSTSISTSQLHKPTLSSTQNSSNTNIEEKKELTLLKDIIQSIQSPQDIELPSDFSFKKNRLTQSLKIAFRAVLLTAYSRLLAEPDILESPPLPTHPRAPLTGIPSSVKASSKTQISFSKTSSNFLNVPGTNINDQKKVLNLPDMTVSYPTSKQGPIPSPSQKSHQQRNSMQSSQSIQSLQLPKQNASLSKSPAITSSQRNLGKMTTPLTQPPKSSQLAVNNQNEGRVLVHAMEAINAKKSQRQILLDLKMLQKKRYAFRILLACTLNHILLINDQSVQLKEFNKYLCELNIDRTPSNKLNNQELLKSLILWTRNISLEQIQASTDQIVNNYLPSLKQFNLSFF